MMCTLKRACSRIWHLSTANLEKQPRIGLNRINLCIASTVVFFCFAKSFQPHPSRIGLTKQIIPDRSASSVKFSFLHFFLIRFFINYHSTVSRFYKIGCFHYKKRVIPELLQDLSGQLNFENTEPAVLKCAELAQAKGYKFFGLGPNGKCYSGPKAGEQYYRYGSATTCVNGAGKWGSTFVYTFGKLVFKQ